MSLVSFVALDRRWTNPLPEPSLTSEPATHNPALSPPPHDITHRETG